MTIHGYSIAPAAATTEETVAANGASILAMADQLMWLRRKMATLLDLTVEPGDIEADEARNIERSA